MQSHVDPNNYGNRKTSTRVVSRGKQMGKKDIGVEVRSRFPRMIMSLVMAILFWIMSIILPPTIEGVIVPGLNLNAGALVGIVTWLFTAVFLIRALSDAVVLSDIITAIIVKRLGIREEKASRRAAREAIYIIIIILVVSALYPFLNTLEYIGNVSTMIITYVSLAIILILIYDIGRILYRLIEERAELLGNRLAKIAEEN